MINGKIKVSIDQSSSINIFVFLMPNSFNEEEAGSRGILQNNLEERNVKNGAFEVPTDWSVWIVYNPSITAGQLTVSSWVDDLVSTDVSKIKGLWQPTRIAFIDYKKLKEEEEERQRLI